ncbi:MAG: DsrE/DsrF/DrsH-like family protein [Planctomycetota bacterium]
MTTATATEACGVAAAPGTKAATFLVFSGELDKQLMAFTLANAAAASGMQVTLFFTFWSLAALRRPVRTPGKGLVERMFGWMLPRGSRALPLSNLNFGGFGSKLIRWRMGKKGVASLEEQIVTAQALGVRIVVCETSMDLMGFRKEEMLEGIELGGATTCLASATASDMAMVI